MIEVVEGIRQKVREVPDFPQEGVLFYDITTVLKDADVFPTSIDLMAEHYKSTQIDVIAAMESRGFILGTLGVRPRGGVRADTKARQAPLRNRFQGVPARVRLQRSRGAPGRDRAGAEGLAGRRCAGDGWDGRDVRRHRTRARRGAGWRGGPDRA